MFYRQFYSELGKLLYAIASTDGVVSEKEKQALKELVRKELVPAEKHTDTHGTDAAYYLEIEFDILDDTMSDPEEAYGSFINFIEKHYSAIDGQMRDSTLKVAKKLAEVYKVSKKEKELIRTLEKELRSLPARN
jgi:uncharacterized tellurite resistance protein B-like protein